MREVDSVHKTVVDEIDWKNLYHLRTGWEIDVSPLFNWQNALLSIERHCIEVEAFCTWNNEIVRLAGPWSQVQNDIIYEETTNSGLISGVERDLECTDISQGVSLQFVYESAFILRGTRQTCAKQGRKPCFNCENKKRCDNQKYLYSIEKLDNPNVNEHLCMHVRSVVDR